MRRYILLSLAGLALIAAAILWTARRGTEEDTLAAQRTLTARVESALDAADYDALEERLSQAHAAAVAARDFKPLRATYATLFVVANRDRFAQTRAWRAAAPDSPYAATALAWQHYQRAFEFRGNALSPYVSQEARAHYHDELEQAQKLAEGGFAKRDDFLPALDLLLQLRRSGVNRLPVLPLIERAFEVAPGRHALSLGLQALDPKWGGSMTEIAALCASAAQKIPDYSDDLCLIETAFQLGLTGPVRAMALDLLDRHDEDFLDYARLDAYLAEWHGRPEAAQQAMRIARAEAITNTVTLSAIATSFGQEAFYSEMKAKAQEALRTRLSYSPQDSAVLIELAQSLIQRRSLHEPTGDPAEAQALWRETLELGGYRGDVWLVGSEIDALANGSWDYDRRRPFYENAIYYSNGRPWAFSEYMMFLGQLHDTARNPIYRLPKDVSFDRDAVAAATACEMVRAVRFFAEACRADPSDRGCRTYGAVEPVIATARALMDQEGCARERTAPLDALQYRPVPIAQILPGTGG